MRGVIDTAKRIALITPNGPNEGLICILAVCRGMRGRRRTGAKRGGRCTHQESHVAVEQILCRPCGDTARGLYSRDERRTPVGDDATSAPHGVLLGARNYLLGGPASRDNGGQSSLGKRPNARGSSDSGWKGDDSETIVGNSATKWVNRPATGGPFERVRARGDRFREASPRSRSSSGPRIKGQQVPVS